MRISCWSSDVCSSDLGILTTVVHFVPMLTDAGVDATRAAGMVGTIGAALIFGRIVVGYLLDRLPAVALAQCLFAMVAAGMLTLVAGGAHVAVVALIAAKIGRAHV